MSQDIFTIGFLGASDVQDRNARNWPNLLGSMLQVGKRSRVRVYTTGYEGQSSLQWFAAGEHIKCANQAPDVAMLSFINDANPAQGISVAQSLANVYTEVDLVRARRSTTRIYLMKMWRSDAVTEAATWPNRAAIHANFDTVAANRANVSVLDFYTPSGNPASHPDEWDPADPVHPLLQWHQRVSLPLSYAAIEPLIT